MAGPGQGAGATIGAPPNGKAKWALIHRVPVFPVGGSGTMSRGKIRWRPYTQWVRVGSPKWNRIHAAAAKSGVTISPTRYTRSVKRPNAPDAAPGTTVTDQLPLKAPNGNVVAGINDTRHNNASPGGQLVGGGGGGKGGKGGRGSGSSGNGGQVMGYIGKPNTGQMVPRSMAHKLAALQFGGQIADTNRQITQQRAQSAQDLHDIASWYGQVAQQAGGAATAAQNAAHQGAQADQNTTAALLHAIGGGANAGAGQVAAAGDNASALQNALATIAQNAGGMMQTAIGNQSAGSQAAQQALNDQAMTALQTQLTSLHGQQGDAQAQALMQIIGMNNATMQQRFQNRLASISAAESAAMLPGQLGLQHQQIVANNITNKQAATQARNNGHIGWNTLDPGTQQKLAYSWMSPDGTTLNTPQKAIALARAQGYTNPAVINYIHTLYS